MSRITGTDAFNLMEAYNAIYAPQEELVLTEEQFTEEVNYWVDSVIEEGYDLSSLSWDDIYLMAEDAVGRTGRNWGQQLGQALRGAASGGLRTAGSVLRGAVDVAGAGLQGYAGQKTTSSSPLARAANFSTRVQTAPVRGGIRFGQGAIEGLSGSKPQVASKPSPSRTFGSDSGGSTGYGRYGQATQLITRPPAAAPTTRTSTTQPAAAPARPTTQPAAAPARPVAQPAARPAAAPARPVAQAPARPAAAPTGGVAKPTTTATTAPAATPAAPRQRDTSITDMIGRSQIRQGVPINTGNVSSDIRSRALRGTDVGGAGGSVAAPVVAARPSTQQQTRQRRLNMDLDLFDIVKGYLIDEGYAETEEAASVIMANMSEEWRQSIIESIV